MASQKLSELRSSRPEFHSLSFEAIAAYGANGAIVHYRCGEDSPIIDDQSMFLLDSGSQYRHGTTDVTRTVHLGTPTDDQIEAYTRVLMGHIDLALARWPSDRGLTGSDLDSLARQHLWQGGLDYLHGTGHGVGSFLGVHEGPHNISHKSRTVQLQPNMITTNEPGYYKEGEWGIRIENM